MKIAVVTPYYKESTDLLRQCHESVLAQGISADHFFVADGFPNQELMKWGIKHISLPQAHDDNGNTPRGIGSIIADIEGYDFISYLDADNWYHPNHLVSMLNLFKETKADICTSFRTFHTLDGVDMSIKEQPEESLSHVDTSCYFINRKAFSTLDVWLKMPKMLSPLCDRVFLSYLINKKHRLVSTKKHTVAFRTQYKNHYLQCGLEPPKNSKIDIFTEPMTWLRTPNGIKETVNKLGFYPF